VPLVLPKRHPCPYCENFARRYAWHGPPAVIAEDEVTFTFLTPAPLGGMDGHTLVIPKRHVETIFDLTGEEEAALGHAVAGVARALRSAPDPDGVLIQQHNGVAAFQTVRHIHFHVIPKRADAPFPPTEEAEVVPYERRVALAKTIRAHWRA